MLTPIPKLLLGDGPGFWLCPPTAAKKAHYCVGSSTVDYESPICGQRLTTGVLAPDELPRCATCEKTLRGRVDAVFIQRQKLTIAALVEATNEKKAFVEQRLKRLVCAGVVERVGFGSKEYQLVPEDRRFV